MADPQFFDRAGPFTLAEVLKISGAEASGADGSQVFDDVAALDNAGASQISFLDNVKYKDQFKITKAGACFIYPDMVEQAPSGLICLTSRAPYKSYALMAQAFYPDDLPKGGISEHAHVSGLASVGEGSVIEAGAVVMDGASIGKSCHVEAGAVIGRNVKIGDYVRIGANANVSHAHIGSYSRLYPGVRVGQDGFGFAIDPKGHVKVPQLGRVIIGQHVEIGANTCIDRGAGPDTEIGDGTWIDNLVQIGHNVKIGRGCIIVSQVGISGSTVLEDFVALGGQVGVAGHLRIGMGARIAAQSGIMKSVPPGEEQMGSPALPIRDFMKQVALLKRLIKKDKGSS
jgi:UDP-3-O-[3-hydroxymyristoyl] glucosamine N-acyltransferase